MANQAVVPSRSLVWDHLWTELAGIGLLWALGLPAPYHSPLRHSQVLSVVVGVATVVIKA